jgi:hypothetical protein
MTERPPGARSLRIEELMTISANLLNKAAAGEVTPALAPFVRNIAHDLAKRIFYVEDLLAALDRAEAFISGFEDDDTQEGVTEMLAAIRAALVNAKGEV